MSFSSIIQKKYKALLPFSYLYRLGIGLHQVLYKAGLKKSYKAAKPTICIGNLAVGGTGKTPMVECLISILEKKYNIATVSRGYGRATKGFIIADKQATAQDIGDEPIQFHIKYPGVKVTVAEERKTAIQYLEKDAGTDIIILDDAMQHHAVTPDFTIMLTAYHNLFFEDYYLPAGELRDAKANYKKAAIIVVTKCPPDISATEAANIEQKVQLLPHQQLYFTSLAYGQPYWLFKDAAIMADNTTAAIMVTGIAHPAALVAYTKDKYLVKHHISFNDHHVFTEADIQIILEQLKVHDAKFLITTEKDATRLKAFERKLNKIPILVIPVWHQFLMNKEERFANRILQFVTQRKI